MESVKLPVLENLKYESTRGISALPLVSDVQIGYYHLPPEDRREAWLPGLEQPVDPVRRLQAAWWINSRRSCFGGAYRGEMGSYIAIALIVRVTGIKKAHTKSTHKNKVKLIDKKHILWHHRHFLLSLGWCLFNWTLLIVFELFWGNAKSSFLVSVFLEPGSWFLADLKKPLAGPRW